MVITKVLLISVALSWILNVVLDPRFGIFGAAVSTTISAWVGVIIAGNYINGKHKIDIKSRTGVRILAGLLIILLLWYLLSNIYIFKGILLLVEYGLLFCTYLLFLLLVGEAGKEDWETVYKMLPKQISDPIRKILKN
jgi:O-antigen/teichoic acid export membrane protein